MTSRAVLGNFAGILFDNEGTLIDASEATQKCWSTFAARYGLPADRVLALVPGRPARDVINHYSERLPVSVDEALNYYLKLAATCTVGIEPIPGAKQLLDSLPFDRWAVVTSGTREFALTRIAAAGLPEPTQLVTADDITAGKPDPEPYLVAAKRLRVSPSDCLAIDDSPSGVQSASSAGCLTVGLLTTHNQSDLAAANTYADDLSRILVSQQDRGLHVEILTVVE